MVRIGALNSKTLGFLKIAWISCSANILDYKSFIIGSSSSFQRPSSNYRLNLSWKKSLILEDCFSLPLPLLLPIELGLFFELSLEFWLLLRWTEFSTLWHCQEPWRRTYLWFEDLEWSLLCSETLATSCGN